MDRLIKIIVTSVFIYIFLCFYKKSFDQQTSKFLKYLSRSLVVLVFFLAFISLAIYAIAIKEVGLTKRIIGAILAFILLLYLIHTIKKYLMISKVS